MLNQDALLVFITGIAAGFVNVVAGGGSLIAMPVLIFLGLPSAVANGTNRVALMVQNLVAVGNFRRKGLSEFKLSLLLAVPAIIGSIIGANLAINLPDEIFNKILAVVMLVMLALVLWQPQKKFKHSQGEMSFKKKVAAFITFLFIGIYGGSIQGGVGFVIMVALTLITGMSLVKINSIKVLVTAFYILPSLLIFILNGKVDWVLGLVLAASNGIGAWLGSNFAVAKGDRWIKVVLTITMVVMSIKLLLGY